MSTTVILTSNILRDRYQELIAFLQANLPNVRGFRGCRKVTVLLNQETGEMVFHEIWTDQAAHADYIEFIQNNGVMAALIGFLQGPPQVSYLEVMDI